MAARKMHHIATLNQTHNRRHVRRDRALSHNERVVAIAQLANNVGGGDAQHRFAGQENDTMCAGEHALKHDARRHNRRAFKNAKQSVIADVRHRRGKRRINQMIDRFAQTAHIWKVLTRAIDVNTRWLAVDLMHHAETDNSLVGRRAVQHMCRIGVFVVIDVSNVNDAVASRRHAASTRRMPGQTDNGIALVINSVVGRRINSTVTRPVEPVHSGTPSTTANQNQIHCRALHS